MKTVLSIVRKEIIHLRRDPRMFAVIFIAPILQLLLLGYAVNLDVRDIPTVVCDMDRSTSSRDFLSRFVNSGYFSLKGMVPAMDDVDAYLDRGRASMALIIPESFGKRLVGGRQATVLVIADGSESQSATVGLSYAAQIAVRYSRGIVVEKLERLKIHGVSPVRVEPEVRVWYNPNLKSRNFQVPGVICLILMVMTMILTSMAVVREKETGTLEQLIVTPIRSAELLIGKLLPFILIGLIDVGLILSVARWILDVPIRGSVVLLFGLSLVFMLTTLGFGLFISTISRNQQQAMLTAVFFMIPMLLLSGFVFPIENMPQVFQWVTYVIPIRYFFFVVRGILLKGAGFPALWDEGLAMLVLGLSILFLSVVRFRKKLE